VTCKMYPATNSKLTPYPGYGTYMPQGTSTSDDDKYIVTTKIMVLALAVLFVVVFFVVCLHIYARWIWSGGGRLTFWAWRRRARGGPAPAGDENIVLDADVLDINTVMGLGKAAVEALPTFTHRSGEQSVECAICLGRVEEGEVGRALPKCGHRFHLECIDMWLYSHSTCPLCRAVLDPHADESISLSFELAPAIQLFHLEPAPPEDVPEHGPGPDPDAANKRADSIPANVLFWGNHAHQSRPFNNNSPQVAIDIEDVASVARPQRLGMRVTPFTPAPSPSGAGVAPSPSPSPSGAGAAPSRVSGLGSGSSEEA
jgi:hypothetical protein